MAGGQHTSIRRSGRDRHPSCPTLERRNRRCAGVRGQRRPDPECPCTGNRRRIPRGRAFVAAVNNCNFLVPETAYFYAADNWRGAPKGEGIAAMLAGMELGRGPQANGGGGGNDHNSGGGGGGNIAAGGTGGDNDEPSNLGCDGYYPGIKGYAIPGTPDRIFMGGGGGAGHANNNLLSGGGRGGGIIFIKAGAIDGASPLIEANGTAAPASNGDGAGGGGAGGAIRRSGVRHLQPHRNCTWRQRRQHLQQ
ncbi:MAG: hypothetical protein IPK76_08590 [Lewinellaceae bacterium]|nr:hypothetical protein [Lewinellaceae bacterium]